MTFLHIDTKGKKWYNKRLFNDILGGGKTPFPNMLKGFFVFKIKKLKKRFLIFYFLKNFQKKNWTGYNKLYKKMWEMI